MTRKFKAKKFKDDVSFVDPTTMEVRCTYNQCVDKFTIEAYEVKTLPSGYEWVSGFHACNQCGQRIQVRGDSSRAYRMWLDRPGDHVLKSHLPKED
jgi:hypothetical protein